MSHSWMNYERPPSVAYQVLSNHLAPLKARHLWWGEFEEPRDAAWKSCFFPLNRWQPKVYLRFPSRWDRRAVLLQISEMTDDDSVCCDAIFQRCVEGLEDDEEFCLVKRILGKAVWCRLAEFCLTFCGFCMDESLLSLAIRPETTCGELQMTAMRRRAIPSFSPWSGWKLED